MADLVEGIISKDRQKQRSEQNHAQKCKGNLRLQHLEHHNRQIQHCTREGEEDAKAGALQKVLTHMLPKFLKQIRHMAKLELAVHAMDRCPKSAANCCTGNDCGKKNNVPNLLRDEPSYDIEAFVRKAMDLKCPKKDETTQ